MTWSAPEVSDPFDAARSSSANLLPGRRSAHAQLMSQRPSSHTITETRDWARIVLAAGIGLAVVILAAQGDLSAAVVTAAASLLR